MARYDYDRGFRRGEPGEQWAWTGARYPEVWGLGRPPQGQGYAFGYGDWVAPYDYLDTARGGYGADYAREFQPLPPQESGAYGRGGDRELRQWARHHGYDMEAVIRPGKRGISRTPSGYGGEYRRARRGGYERDYLGRPIHRFYDAGYQTWREGQVRW